MSRQPLLLVLAGCLTACAWGPGAGFATLSEARLGLSASLPAGRLDDQGRWKTNTGWRVALDDRRLSLQLGALALESEGEARSGGGGGTFDPRNPPPRYSNCHGGHCHRDDGALVDYADIQAELDGKGGPAGANTLVRLGLPPSPQPLALGETLSLTLGTCEPHCHLPRTAVTAVRLDASTMTAAGSVALAEGAARRFSLRLPLTGLTWRAQLAAPVSVALDGPARLRLEVAWRLPDNLFDDLTWETLLAKASDGPVDLAADRATRDLIQDHLREAAVSATLRPVD